MDWVIDKHIEPLEFSTPLTDCLPVVEQNLDGIDNSLHGVEAVGHGGGGLCDVADAKTGGLDSLELNTLDVTIGESFKGDGVDGHSLDVEPLSGRGSKLFVLSKPFWVDFSGEWVAEANETFAVGLLHSVFDFSHSLLSERRFVVFVVLGEGGELATGILNKSWVRSFDD